MHKFIASLLIIGATVCLSGCMSSGSASFHYSGLTYSKTGGFNSNYGSDNNNITSYGSIRNNYTIDGI